MPISPTPLGSPTACPLDHQTDVAPETDAAAPQPDPHGWLDKLAVLMRERARERVSKAERDAPLGAALIYPDPMDEREAENNRHAAAAALYVVRQALHDRARGSLKSDNKWSAHQASEPGKDERSGYVFTPLRSMEKRSDLCARAAEGIAALNAWERKDRNCGALTQAAVDLLGYSLPSVQASFLCLEDDHTLMVAGTVSLDLIGKPLEAWPAHLHVCDPWANITCPAPAYPKLFQAKMRKWVADGKRILIKGEEGWQSPGHPVSMRRPDRLGYLIVYQGHESGQSVRTIFMRSKATLSRKDAAAGQAVGLPARRDGDGSTTRSTGDIS